MYRMKLLVFVCLFAACQMDKSPSENEDTNLEATENDLLTESELLLLELVNQQRAQGCKCGKDYFPPVPPLTWNEQLATTALLHSEDMAANHYFDHEGKDGSQVSDRAERQDYVWRAIGENIAYNYPNEEAVIEGWIKSPGHCRNIMSGKFQEMGVAKAGDYWTQVFGTARADILQ